MESDLVTVDFTENTTSTENAVGEISYISFGQVGNITEVRQRGAFMLTIDNAGSDDFSRWLVTLETRPNGIQFLGVYPMQSQYDASAANLGGLLGTVWEVNREV